MSLVMWSGGCDSTLVLYRDARSSSQCQPSRALSIIHPQIAANAQQKLHREMLKREFTRRGLPIEYTEVTFQREGIACVGDFRQSAMWISLGALHLNDNEQLLLGHVKEDTIWHNNWTPQLFTALLGEMRIRGTLLFPLEWTKKHDVVEELKKEKLHHLCWSCDSYEAGLTPCGKCDKCKEENPPEGIEYGKNPRATGSRQRRSRKGSRRAT